MTSKTYSDVDPSLGKQIVSAERKKMMIGTVFVAMLDRCFRNISDVVSIGTTSAMMSTVNAQPTPSDTKHQVPSSPDPTTRPKRFEANY